MSLACFWAFKSGAVDIDGVKAGVLRQVVKIDPGNIDAHRFLADYYDYSDRYEEAIRAYKETVRIDPNDLHAQLNLAFACDSLGRFEEAAQAYREAIRAAPFTKKRRLFREIIFHVRPTSRQFDQGLKNKYALRKSFQAVARQKSRSL